MGHSYYKNWIHLIWATKNRFPYFDPELQQKLYSHILINARKKNLEIKTLGGFTDHVHILMNINPKDSISSIVHLLKGESSHWINSEKLVNTHFSWQDGYSVFSVSESQFEKVDNYIKGQMEHHKKFSFTDEVKKLLALHKLEMASKED